MALSNAVLIILHLLAGAIPCLNNFSLGRNFGNVSIVQEQRDRHFIKSHLVSVCFIAYVAEIFVTDSKQA